jgi:uncharacterized protein YcfJ
MRKGIKSSLIALGIVGSAPLSVSHAQGTEWAEVIDVVPVYKHVPVTQRVCTTQEVFVTPQKSGAGALMGAIAGGVIGSRFGKGGGNSAATAVGMIGGAMIGDRIETTPIGQNQSVQHCNNETAYQSVADGYRVTYEYAGKHYEVRTPDHPGARVAIEIRPQIKQSNLGERRYKLAAHERRYH